MRTKSLNALMLCMLLLLSACGKKRGIINGHEWVDLGLPSGTLWATCNVGADSPQETGDFFAWGEVEPKSEYSWNTYRHGHAKDKITKYSSVYGEGNIYGYRGFIDNKTCLEQLDDAATVNWGAEWCTPSVGDWAELAENCEWKQILSPYNNDSIGVYVTGPNGNSIFLPSRGRFKKYEDYNRGFYWACEDDGCGCACGLEISYGVVCPLADAGLERCEGLLVRPIVVRGK